MKITQLLEKNFRIQVFLDGKYAFSCTPNFAVNNTFYVDKEIDEQELETLKNEAQYSILENKLIEYALRKKYSRRQLSQKLSIYAKKRFKSDLDLPSFEKAFKRLQELQLYNETEIITNHLYNLIHRKKGENYIKQKLTQAGFDKTTISQISSQFFTKNAKFAQSNLQTLLEKKKNDLLSKKLDAYTLKSKLVNFGLQKGYSYGEIKEVVNHLK